jgi:acetyl-CoA/propionyl-CoA carboxylase, biotin carboxylase, biotin carboxyl carrier protein
MERLLIAERGEAAVRIARTAKRLGITTVALRRTGDPDDALHLDACDEAQPEPEEPGALAEIARACKADAVHPGYADRLLHERVAALEAAGVSVVAASADALARCLEEGSVEAAAARAGLRPTPAEGLDRPRRLDMIAVADRHGGTAYLGEMELLVRQDGPPLLAESPAPALVMRHDGEAVREAMGQGTARLLGELGITGLATVHFLFDMDGRLWLSGITPGLTALHSPIELTSGLDLVEVELRVAQGEALWDGLFTLQPHGHAFAVRVEATGALGEPVTDVRWPPAPHGRVRADPSVHVGMAPEEPLLIKVATFSPVRHQALLTLDRVLAATTVAPYATNVPALRAVLNDETFRACQYDVTFHAAHPAETP